MHQIHSFKSLLIMSAASSAVVGLLEALYTYGDEEVSYPQKVVTEFLIDESTVCKCMEGHVLMFLAESDYIVFSYQRLTSCKQVSVNSQFFAFCHDFVHFLICKVQLVAVFCCPAACTVEIAGRSRIHQNYPRNVAVVLFRHFQRGFESPEASLVSCIKCKGCQNVRINLFQNSLCVMCPFAVRLACQLSEHFIG